MARAAGRLVLVALLALVLGPRAEAATPTHVTGIELTKTVQQALGRLPELWVQWISAFYQDHPEEAERVLAQLEATARQLGMERLPDLSLAASMTALEAASTGQTERARWALLHAEVLDPGRPSTAFAQARLEWNGGSRVAAVRHQASGFVRLFSLRLLRELWAINVALWAAYSLLLSGAIFVVLQMLFNGRFLYVELLTLAGRHLPGPSAHLPVIVFLLWPLLLPSGFFWLLAFWSVLLWIQAEVGERVVLGLLWLLLATIPSTLTLMDHRLEVELSPPAHALDNLAEGRLYDGLFSDLAVLRDTLPEEPAVRMLLADVHRWLGQWELATASYRTVLELEPQSLAALNNIGVFYFLQGDAVNAISYFQQATTADALSAVAYYNLSQAYSESYLFEDQKAALNRARQLDEERVSSWIQHPPGERVVSFEEGTERIPEIRRSLEASWGGRAEVGQQRPWAPIVVSLGLFVAAMALRGLHRSADASGALARVSLASLDPQRWARIAIPGLSAAKEGRGVLAFVVILFPVALLLVPFVSYLGVRLPWGVGPMAGFSWFPVGLCLLGFFTMRWLDERGS